MTDRVNDIERLGEAQRKYGSFNIMLAFCMVVAIAGIGTIIWQNTRALEKIADSQKTIAVEMLSTKLAIEALKEDFNKLNNKFDFIFLSTYDIKVKKEEK